MVLKILIFFLCVEVAAHLPVHITKLLNMIQHHASLEPEQQNIFTVPICCLFYRIGVDLGPFVAEITETFFAVGADTVLSIIYLWNWKGGKVDL